MAKLILNIPEDTAERLNKMATETTLSRNALVTLAAASLVANYEQKGSFIFADLLNPEHRDKGGRK